MSVEHKLNAYIDQENLHNTEGRHGLENLCKIVSAIGYEDRQCFGQLSNGTSIGDLVNFIEDNPGVIEAITTWICEQGGGDWEDNLDDLIEKESEEDDSKQLTGH